jgi:hypothetical protein
VLVSLVGATLNGGLVLPPNDRPGLQAGIGLSTDVLAQPPLRAALTLAIVLPIYFWRRAIILGRARKPSPQQLVAVAAVVMLHVAMFVLISAPAPRIGSNTNDTAMTLVVVPPVTQPPVVVSGRATPPTMRSREIVILPPTMPAEGAAPAREPAPIHFAREAALAAQHGAAAIELERRRGDIDGASRVRPRRYPRRRQVVRAHE